MWLEDYTKAFRNKYAKETTAENLSELHMSLLQARQTFFTSSSRFELNVTPECFAKFDEMVESPTVLITPDDLKEIRDQVESMLNESLHRFVMGCCTNSGTARGIFGVAVGLAAMSIALAPVLLSILRGESRWIRFAALPCLWFGAMTVIGSLQGVSSLFDRTTY